MYSLMDKVTQDIPEELNGFDIYDPLTLNWNNFNFRGDEDEIMLSPYQIQRPDLFSYALYGTVIYQDIIFNINGYADILNLPAKTQLKIPHLEDLKEFIRVNRKG